MLALTPGTRTPLCPPSTHALRFTRKGCIALLDMNANRTFRTRPVNVRMHSIDFCHPHSMNEHPCLGDFRFVPRTRACALARSLTREPAGSRQPARCDEPGLYCRGALSSLRQINLTVSLAPRHLNPSPPSLSRELRADPDQDHPHHALSERCMDIMARSAFCLQRPSLGSPSDLRLCRRSPRFDVRLFPEPEPGKLDPRSRHQQKPACASMGQTPPANICNQLSTHEHSRELAKPCPQ